MRILAVDTALGACSAAVLDGDQILSRAHEDMTRGHAEHLAPMVEAVVKQSGLGFPEIERLGVTTGPGTFTGQRVGLAFIRAMAVALKIPAVGVTTLETMCAEALGCGGALAVAVNDAKRGEVYLGACDAAGLNVIAPTLLPVEDAVSAIVALATDSLVLAGTAAEDFVSRLGFRGLAAALSKVRQPDAVFVARLAADRAPDGPPRPLYLREPDAKLPAQ